MKDREAVLRYLTFRLFGFEKYDGDMSGFVENAMKAINNMSDKDINKLKIDFQRSMKLTFEFFGERNFRMPTESTRGSISMAVLESIAYYFAVNEEDYLRKNKKEIIKNYDKLLKDKIYCEAVQHSTGTKVNVLNRFNKTLEILGKR